MFGKIIRNLRIENNETQVQLANSLGTTQKQISKWETERIEPNISSLMMLADYFDISIDELVGRK